MMKEFGMEKNPQLKIETVKTPEGNEVSFCPERGGIITSIKFDGNEVLYMDDETFNNKEVNVKGGVPILFPNAGPIHDEIKTDELKNLKQHGFVREFKWNYQKEENGFSEVLTSNPKTKEIFPYDFKLSIKANFDNNSFIIKQEVENTDKEKILPISSGFHPYFKVSSREKKNINFNFQGGEKIKEKTEIWANGEVVSVENPNVPFTVDIPGLGELHFEISKEYKRILVWSQEGKDFVCIEPVMRDKGGIVSDPEKIQPGVKHESFFKISKEK